MDAGISRSSIPPRNDPHDWNSWDHYRTIHEERLANHPFIDPSQPHTLEFTFDEDEGILLLNGQVYCLNDVILEVEKWYETRYFGRILRVRAFSYRYVAWVKNGNSILRYHNIHVNDSYYHHRVFDWRTGEQILYERLERYQFPTFPEVLDELDALTRDMESG